MTKWLRQYGMTPGRAAIMAVLALALVAVWGPQLFSSGDSEPVIAVATPPKPKPAAAVARPAVSLLTAKPLTAKPLTASTATAPKPQKKRALPKFTASEAGAYDPFAAPAWSPAAVSLAAGSGVGGSTADAEDRFKAIRSRGVAMILVSPDGKAAQLGDRTVRIGDQIDGFEVIDITPTGVVFMPAGTRPAEGVDGA
jgi:hypothetical protein